VPVAAVAVEVAAVEPVSASAPVAVVGAVGVAVGVVVVLALRSSDTPTHRKVERHQSPQVLRSISYRLG
jgi:hypothetical protein